MWPRKGGLSLSIDTKELATKQYMVLAKIKGDASEIIASARVLKSIKHKKSAMIFCPRCASPDIKSTAGFGGINMWLTPPKYFCKKCGYVGPIVMELEKEEESGD
jgi:hypothetical protein